MEREIELYRQFIIDEWKKAAPSIIETYPISNYLHEIQSQRDNYGYHCITPKLSNIFAKIRRDAGQHTLALYHRLASIELMLDSIKYFKQNKIPSAIYDQYCKWYSEILHDFPGEPDEYFDPEDDRFLKDLGVCSRILIPVSATVIVVSQFPRKFIIQGGMRDSFRRVFFACDKLDWSKYSFGKFAPFYEMHIVQRTLKYYNPEGWYQNYILIAEMLKLNPEIRGVFGKSWFFDPELETVSPNLSYLRSVPLQGGASLFKMDISQLMIDLAIYKSRTRRRLYQEGKYMPTSYLMIWPRSEMLRWADSRNGIAS